MKLDSKQLKHIRILYVEDDSTIRNQTKKILDKLFKKIYVAEDGEEGFAVYKEHSADIDIIVTDINMPKINGLDMIKNINSINNSIPTIVTTAHSDSKYLLEAIDINIDKYITKPIQIKELTVSIVDLVVKYKRINNIENLAKSLVAKTTQNDKENSQLHNELEILKNKNNYLSTIVDNMVLNLKINKNGTILEASHKFKIFFESSKIEGKSISILQCESCEQESFQKLMLKAIHSKKTVISTYTLSTTKGRRIDVEVTLTPFYGNDALVNGYTVYLDLI